MVCRNLLIALVLAALSAHAANGFRAPSATEQDTAPTPSPSHKKMSHRPAHPAAHKAAHAKIHRSTGKHLARNAAIAARRLPDLLKSIKQARSSLKPGLISSR